MTNTLLILLVSLAVLQVSVCRTISRDHWPGPVLPINPRMGQNPGFNPAALAAMSAARRRQGMGIWPLFVASNLFDEEMMPFLMASAMQ